MKGGENWNEKWLVTLKLQAKQYILTMFYYFVFAHDFMIAALKVIKNEIVCARYGSRNGFNFFCLIHSIKLLPRQRIRPNVACGKQG